jgi:hypothetical protein
MGAAGSGDGEVVSTTAVFITHNAQSTAALVYNRPSGETAPSHTGAESRQAGYKAGHAGEPTTAPPPGVDSFARISGRHGGAGRLLGWQDPADSPQAIASATRA